MRAWTRKWVVVSMVAALVLVAAGCEGVSDGGAGALPNPQVGDTWVQNTVADANDYTFSLEVTGEEEVEGKKALKVEALIDPPIEGVFDSSIMFIDKATMDVIRTLFAGRSAGANITSGTTNSYEYAGGALYPLKVGKEVKVKESKETTTTVSGKTTSKTEVNNYTYRVEALEEITIPLGRFLSYKVVRYGEDGQAAETKWLSDKVGPLEVKQRYEDDSSAELVSYSYKAGAGK